uniref:Uncharacterized protein n=1 Tax=Physcomitrium patens TaxID=3218 RepID=A0A2K1JKK7_PHYPA|nr:hypothetical protein PHYPA_016923 [Physcomitrium patens]
MLLYLVTFWLCLYDSFNGYLGSIVSFGSLRLIAGSLADEKKILSSNRTDKALLIFSLIHRKLPTPPTPRNREALACLALRLHVFAAISVGLNQILFLRDFEDF